MKVLLQPEPTFTAPVDIHVPGKGRLGMEWTFSYRNKKALDELSKRWEAGDKSKKPPTHADRILDVACGWELVEPFTKANVEIFLRSYPTAFLAVIKRYFEEVYGAKAKN